jgi:pyruvate,water dikinase
MSGHVRSLAELRHADEARFGGKSAGLGELLAAGIAVPPGFALSCSAYELAGRDGPMPGPVRDEVTRAYAELGEHAAVAVRSSAVGEDSVEATFAGQQETVLSVRGVDHVCEAIRSCWASLYSPTAIAYRARLGDGAREPAMGVAVQVMVDPVVAGVLFTCNPVSGDRSMVAINASWGLGVSVVAGEVTPDEYLVSKVTGEVVRERIGSKEIEYVPDPRGRGTLKREVPGERRVARCLDPAAVAALLDVARAIERHFGAAQDVEWALASGGLFVLQSRPVTAVPERDRETREPASALSLVMKTFGARG